MNSCAKYVCPRWSWHFNRIHTSVSCSLFLLIHLIIWAEMPQSSEFCQLLRFTLWESSCFSHQTNRPKSKNVLFWRCHSLVCLRLPRPLGLLKSLGSFVADLWRYTVWQGHNLQRLANCMCMCSAMCRAKRSEWACLKSKENTSEIGINASWGLKV